MKLNGEFLSVLHIVGRECLILLVGQPMIWILMMTLMERKKGCWWPFVWMAFQSLTAQILIGAILLHYYGTEEWFMPVTFLYKVATMGITQISLCVLFNRTVLPVALADMIAETIGTSITSVVVIVVNMIGKREDLLSFGNTLQWEDLLMLPLGAVLFSAVYFPIRPLLKKYRTYKIRHTRLLGGIFIFYMLFTMAQYWADLANGNQVFRSLYAYNWICCLVILTILVFFYMRFRGGIRTEREFLEKKQKLLEKHYTAVQMQTCHMENVKAAVQEKLGEIAKEQDKEAGNQKVEEYIYHLRREYEGLRAGIYCNDWILDAFLYSEAESLANRGITLECVLSGYDRGEIDEKDLIQILFRILSGNRLHEGQKVELRMSCLRGQLLIETVFQEFRGRNIRMEKQMRDHLKQYLNKYSGTMDFSMQDEKQIVLIGLHAGEGQINGNRNL